MYCIKNERRAIVFYATNLDLLDVFPEEVQQEIALWILEYGFTGQLTDCPDDMHVVLRPILCGIATQVRRYKNIETLRLFISQIEERSISVIDKNEREAMENAVKALKKGIVRCKKRDIPFIEVKKLLHSVFGNETIFKHMGVSEDYLNRFIPEDEKFPRPSKKAKPVIRTAEDWKQYERDLRKT